MSFSHADVMHLPDIIPYENTSHFIRVFYPLKLENTLVLNFGFSIRKMRVNTISFHNTKCFLENVFGIVFGLIQMSHLSPRFQKDKKVLPNTL